MEKASKGRPVSIKELEQSMQSTTIQNLDRPPGLEQAYGPQHLLVREETFSVPNSAEGDNYSDFMTQKEKDIVAHLHISQLRTGLPANQDDYYYINLSKKASKEQEGRPLYFPTPQIKSSRHIRATEFKVEGSLGSISKASHHRPRTQFQPPSISKRIIQEGFGGLEWEIKRLSESMFAHALTFDLAQLRLSENVEASEEAQEADHNSIRRMQGILHDALYLDYDDESWASSNFVIAKISALLQEPKGRRAVGRAINVLSPEHSLLFIKRLFGILDQIFCLRDSEMEEHFLSDVIASCVGCVSRADTEYCAQVLEILIKKTTLPWLLQHKTGLIVVCMLLSRLEVIKQQQEADNDGLEHIYENLYVRHLRDHLVDIFFTNLGPKEQYVYYVWQLLALLAVNIDGEKKREMVLELRETVMGIVESKNQRAIKNMNVFLNALGLDAAQLST
jgi:hypothetical protein